MMAIINEASGERAMHHVEELVPYQRVRPASECNRQTTRVTRGVSPLLQAWSVADVRFRDTMRRVQRRRFDASGLKVVE